MKVFTRSISNPILRNQLAVELSGWRMSINRQVANGDQYGLLNEYRREADAVRAVFVRLDRRLKLEHELELERRRNKRRDRQAAKFDRSITEMIDRYNASLRA